MNTHDRCDVRDCGAQAYVRVMLKSGILQFCGHHFAANESAIKSQAVDILDERAALAVRLGGSA